MNLATVPLSDGGVAPAARIVRGETTTLLIEQHDKSDGMMVGCYYGYFFDQWPWQGGSGGGSTTLGPPLEGGRIWVELDVRVVRAGLETGRLRFSVAAASWERRSVPYKNTEYDFWNGPDLNSGVIWTEFVRIFKGPQVQLGEWTHLAIDISRLIEEAYGMSTGYLQAAYVVVEWDGNNSSALEFRTLSLYRAR